MKKHAIFYVIENQYSAIGSSSSTDVEVQSGQPEKFENENQAFESDDVTGVTNKLNEMEQALSAQEEMEGEVTQTLEK